MISTAVEFQGASATPAGEARFDARRRGIVEDGIALQGSSNTMAAVEFLRQHGVGAHIIARVLLKSLRRRSEG